MGGRARSATEPLIGRVQDVADIRAIIDAGFEQGAAAILRGSAGVGKTRLLEEASEYAAALGARVLWGSGAQFEAELSFAVMHQLLQPMFGDLEALPDVSRVALESALGLGEPLPTQPLAVYSALLSLLTDTAGSQPLLVVVDDLHWVDASSAAAIDFLARRLNNHPIVLLGALRTGERTRFDGNGIAALDLYPLARHDAEQLILSRFPQLPGNVRQQLVDEAAGYPLS
jgi:predicted ATPase